MNSCPKCKSSKVNVVMYCTCYEDVIDDYGNAK